MDQKDIIQNQLHRVVEVYQPDTNRQGSGFRGSGFAVTSNLILTANHVVQYSQQVYLRGLGWPDFYEAQVVWRSESWDAALVNVVNAPWVYALDPSHLRWMHIAGETPVRWVAYGFPRVAQLRSQKGYELEALTGFVIPGAGQKQGMLVLNISSALPREDTKSDSPWSGISGAAILTEQGHHLLGFVSHDPPHFQVSRLEGIPVERLTTDPGFVRLVGIEHTEAYHVPSPLPPPSSTPFMQKRGRFIDQLRPEYDKRLQERLPGATKMSLWVRPLTNGLPDASALALLSIVQAYENAGAGLLVLGAPGSGKSILLLELAQKLLTRAKQDPTQPVPVLVNLSSWADKKRPLDLWLRDRLWPEYGIGPDLTQRAIEEDRLIFLLDGFDEVEGSARSNCIQEIIAYRKKQLIPIVLCSRKEEFEEHKGQLKLPLMVEVQPLTSQQVDEYLTIEGTSLATLRSVLQSNNVLRGLLTTPLMLGVAMQTYSNTQVKEFPQQGSAEQQQRQVFDHYVTRALETHSTRSWRYTSDQTRTWLIWLAKQMQQRGFTEFYVEQLQFSWVSLNHS
ncbi:MAG TPA: NACHT domain-containing protein [Ktedonobacteraceae bacterium]|nr:NACHT domain-containing protein [Ktedonobacteraceae bacterium]